MTRLQKTSLAVLLSLPLLFAAGLATLYGLANTERGSRFLLTQAESLLAETVTWDSVEGSLLDSFQLRGIRVTQPELDVEIDTLAIAWHPMALLGRVLHVSTLKIDGLRITQRESADAQGSEPFDPGTLRAPVAVHLDEVVVENIAVTDAAGTTQFIDTVDLQGDLDGDQVNLRQLAIEVPQGTVQLQLQTQLRTAMPIELSASGEWQLVGSSDSNTGGGAVQMPDEAVVSGDVTVSGTLDWHRGTAFDLSYAVSASGLAALSAEIPEQAAMDGALAGRYLDDALELENFTLALAETSLELALSGGVSQLATDTPAFALRAAWTGAQWPLTFTQTQSPPEFTSARGDFTFDGVPEDYQFGFFAELAGAEIPPSSWRGQGTGDLQHVNLEQLQGLLLDGQVTVAGPVWWEPLPRWQLAIDLADIDPGVFNPDFPGRLTGSLSTAGSIDADNALAAGVDVQLLAGELIGYPFELATQAQLQGEQVALTQLALSSGDNRIEASGQLSEEALDIAWQLQANEPGLFVPGASGTAEASGTVRGSVQAPLVQVSASAKELAVDTLLLPELSVEAVAGLAADDALQLSVSSGPVLSDGEAILGALQLKGSGTTGKHTLTLDLENAQARVQTRLSGGVTEDLQGWAGELVKLDVFSEELGSWQLHSPAALALSASAASLDNTCLGLPEVDDAFCVAGSWAQGSDSVVEAQLRSLSLARWVPLMTGVVSGDLAASLATDGRLRGSTTVNMGSGTVEVPLEAGSTLLPHGGGSFNATIDERGLTAQALFDAPQNGKVQASVAIPGFSSLPLNDTQPLTGRVKAALPDVSGFVAWLPEVSTLEGALQADLALAGTIAQPAVTGDFAFTGGAADIPVAGISLRNIVVNAVTDASAPERIALSGGLESGEGRLKLSGEIDVARSTADMKLIGDRLLVFDTRDARVVLAPDVDIGWKNDTLILRGDVRVPRADITPKLSLNQSAQGDDTSPTESTGQVIVASPDVVIVNGPVELTDSGSTSAAAVAPVRIDSQLRLLLGDRVQINSLGFISRITGDVLFTNSPDQVDLIPMANGSFSIEDGTFRAFGQDLEIEEGRILFANVPATEPELNLRAVRWIDNDPEVSAAGVLLTGSVTAPELELFSRPQLDASEIQSYLLTGRSAGDRDSVLSIGTYVSRRVYVGYGYNLLESTSEFNSLFSITPRYGVGASVGEADNNINVTFTLER